MLCPYGAVLAADALRQVRGLPHFAEVLTPGHFDQLCDVCADTMKLNDEQRAAWVSAPMPRREAIRRLVVRRAG